MSHLRNPATARLLLTLSVLPTALLVPTIAAADTAAPSTKAQVEHAEQLSARAATKAQVEHAERASATAAPARMTTATSAHSPATAGGGDAAAWQIAASAAVGALVTGLAMGGARLVSHHPRALAH